MNIITVARALKALDGKIIKLEGARLKAKDKPRWDSKQGVKLAVAKHQAATLRVKLVRELKAQGQFEHNSLGYRIDRGSQDER